MVVHYLVNKKDIIKLAEEGGDNNAGGGLTKTNVTGLMKFNLSPLSATTSSDLVSNTGGIHAALSWSPNPLAANTQPTLNISFYDPTSTVRLTNTNVRYNLIIYDKNNHTVITKQNLLAKNATDTEILNFPAKEIYHIGFLAGMFFVGVQLLQKYGYVSAVNWDKLGNDTSTQIQHWATSVDVTNVHSLFHTLGIPVSGGLGLGFLAGFVRTR